MRWAGPDTRWLAAACLIVPSLLLMNPVGSIADGGSARPQKRAAIRAQGVKLQLATKRKGRAMSDARSATCKPAPRSGNASGRAAARLRLPRSRSLGSPQATSSTPLLISQRLAARFCAPKPASRPLERRIPAVELEDGLLLAPVGPAHVPTRLFIAVPEFHGEDVEFVWPVDGIIASTFGRRHGGWHAGLDIMADPGTPVQAAAAGVVQYSGWAGSYGRLITIQHPNGFTTVYAHNDEVLVQAGDEVAAGTQIATVGRTGRVTGEHLHFEIRRDGMAYNPLHLLAPRDGPPILASADDGPSEVLLQAAETTDPVDEHGDP